MFDLCKIRAALAWLKDVLEVVEIPGVIDDVVEAAIEIVLTLWQDPSKSGGEKHVEAVDEVVQRTGVKPSIAAMAVKEAYDAVKEMSMGQEPH